MRYKDQMEWIDSKLDEMKKEIKSNPSEKVKEDYRALLAIKYDYKYCNERLKLSNDK